jgi:3-phenylpropionate/cinnamic acid dioxygenase small subunit
MDEAAIAALLYRYARAVDTKDWELYRSVFTDDAYIDCTNIESDIDGDTAKVRTPDGWRSRHLREENVWFVNAPSG